MAPKTREIAEALTGSNPPLAPFSEGDWGNARRVLEGDVQAAASLPEPLIAAICDVVVRERRLPLAEALLASSAKPVVKAARKALYQLRSSGVAVPIPAAPSVSPPKAVAPVEDLPGLLSAITGVGERALIIVRPVRGGLEAVQLVLSDEQGATHLSRNEVSRGLWKRQLKEVALGNAPPAIEVSRDEARQLVTEAAGLNLSTRTPFPPGFEETLRHLDATPVERPFDIPAPESDDARTATSGHFLHNERELQPWLPPEPDIRELAQKMDEILASPLQLSAAQRSEQIGELVRRVSEAFFTPPRRQLYARRLWRMAEFFDRLKRPQPATLARAEARRLFHTSEPSRFGEFLFEKVILLTQRAQAGQGMPAEGEALAEPAPPSTGRKSPGGLILP